VPRPPDRRDLAAAGRAVRTHLAPTPLIEADLPATWLKLETLQPTGSFKVRGAVAAIASLPSGRAVVAASAGNHALAVAWAASRLGHPAAVVVPRTASRAKLAALRRWPVRLRQRGTGYEAAEKFAMELARRLDAEFISPYDHPLVIAGQATIGAELEALAPPLTVVCPVGGGGLCAGLGLWAAGRPGTDVVGVEAAASPSVSAAVAAGRVVPVAVGPTLADGLAGNLAPEASTPMLISAHVGSLVQVSEAEIAAAMRWSFERHGLVVEGAGATALAAVLAGRVNLTGTVVVVLSGRNVDAGTYRRVLAGSLSRPMAARTSKPAPPPAPSPPG
jgi:threonine dehydratase